MHIRRAPHTCASWCAVSLHLLDDEDKEGNDKDNDEDKEMDKSGRNIDINLIPPVTPFIPFLAVDTEMNNWVLSGVCILKRTCKYGSVS